MLGFAFGAATGIIIGSFTGFPALPLLVLGGAVGVALTTGLLGDVGGFDLSWN